MTKGPTSPVEVADGSTTAERPAPPPDLVVFLRTAEPRTLLLTGQPGVGKTTLALSLLASLDRPSFFISTRVGRGNLLHHFPWLVGLLPPDHLIDLEEVRPASDRQEDLLHLLDRLTDTVDPLSAGRRLRDFLSFPEPLARAVGEPPVRAGHRVLFIDSWEGLIDPYIHLLGLDELGRSGLEHGLLSLFHAAGFSLVLCAESVAPPSLQYLADGVVELRAEPAEGGMLRHLEVRKLRGTAIPRSSMAFTLHGGRFTHCPPLPPLRRQVRGPIRPAASSRSPPGTLTFGVPLLDQAIGHIEPGEAIVAELEGRGASTPLAALLFPLWVRALEEGWNVTLLTDLAHRPKVAVQTMQEALADPKAVERLHFLPREGRSSPQLVWEDLTACLEQRSAVDVSIRTLAALTQDREEGLVSRLSQLQVKARESQSVVVFVVGSSDPVLPMIATMVPLHISLRNHHGTFLISGRYPPTPHLAVLINEDGGEGRTYRYLPMV